MSRLATFLRNGLFPLAMVLSLGFGASQSLAAPASAAAARACDELQCRRSCLALGHPYGACGAGAGEVCHCWD